MKTKTEHQEILHDKGVALSQSLRWDGVAILEVARAALEDANFHGEAAIIDEMMAQENIRLCNACSEPLYGLVRRHHHTEDGKDVTGL
jgi:hypothetical protein